MTNDPLLNAIYNAIRAFNVSNMADEDGQPYPLVDLMTNKGRSIAEGEEQMGELAFAVRDAVLTMRENAA